ncbi:MAG: NADH-quinone oxidoreductase subunit NuoH [Acidobacteriota bacterium]
MDLFDVLATIVKVALVVGILISTVPVLTWVERRGSAFIQLRLGPNRVGPLGLLQPLADGIKFLFKEDVIPPHVYKPFYVAAPAVSFIAAVLAFAVIPFGSAFVVDGRTVPLVILDVDVGVLFLLAASGMGVFGIILAGWSSNNKYSMLGGLRSSAQMISYELSLGLAIVSVLIYAGTLRPVEIVQQQIGGTWNVFPLFIGFLILLVSAFAETNRLPFDLPEAETELVAGYHTEYSSMKFSMFFMAEYINMITGSALVTTLFLGGYALPFQRLVFEGWLGLEGNLLAVLELLSFTAKVGFFLWLFVWVRWTLPRFRFDQLMRLGWKVLIPLALVHVVWASLLVMWGVPA